MDGTPPGPQQTPEANVFAMRRDPIGFFARLAREYGDLVCFETVTGPMYVVGHPDLVREVLVTQDRSFKKWFAVDRTRNLLGNGLLVSEGPYHHRQRRLVQPAFHRQQIVKYAEVMSQSAARLSERWRGGRGMDIGKEMSWLTMVIVSKALFGADVDGEASEISEALTEILDQFDRSVLPEAERMEYEAARARLDATIYRIIAQRRNSGEERDDLLSLLINARDPETDDSRMTDVQLRDEVMTLFLAGHETSANGLAWCWYLLASNPEARRRLEAEIDAVLQGREPAFEDTPNLPCCRMAFLEALRLYPPVWAVAREAIAEATLEGYRIEPGAVVILPQYLIQRDARFFPEPERFLPERWTPESERSRPRFSFFPFSAGSRQCLGESFAMAESILALAALAQRWRLELVPNQKIEVQARLTTRARNGIQMLPTLRAGRE